MSCPPFNIDVTGLFQKCWVCIENYSELKLCQEENHYICQRCYDINNSKCYMCDDSDPTTMERIKQSSYRNRNNWRQINFICASLPQYQKLLVSFFDNMWQCETLNHEPCSDCNIHRTNAITGITTYISVVGEKKDILIKLIKKLKIRKEFSIANYLGDRPCQKHQFK